MNKSGGGNQRVAQFQLPVKEHSVPAIRQLPVLTDIFLPKSRIGDRWSGVFLRQSFQYGDQPAARRNMWTRQGVFIGQHGHQHRDVPRRNRRGVLLPVEQVAMQTRFVGRYHFSPICQTVARFQAKGKAKSNESCRNEPLVSDDRHQNGRAPQGAWLRPHRPGCRGRVAVAAGTGQEVVPGAGEMPFGQRQLQRRKS